MKKYAILLPDILIFDNIDIFYVLNFKEIRIYTLDIYDGNSCVGNSQLSKLLYDITCGNINVLIIYKKNLISYQHLLAIKNVTKKNKNKIIYIE